MDSAHAHLKLDIVAKLKAAREYGRCSRKERGLGLEFD